MWITSLFWLLSAVAWAGSPPGNPPGRTGAPNALSIGNRLFQDYNRNGIQDATDPGIANVPVYLYENGVLRGSTTSAADGSYQFSSTNVTNGLKASTAYEVRVLRSDFPSGMSLTRQNVNGNANDATDSDAQLVGNLAVISVTTSGSDQASNNNDFGFSAGDPDLSITKTSNVSSVTLGSNVSFTIQVTNVAANATDVATGVTVKDTLDLGLTYVSSSPAATVSTVGSGSATQTVLTWSLGTISGANSSSTVTVTATANAEGVLFNTAYVTADPSSGLPEFNVSNNVSRACVTVPVKLCAGEGYVASIPASFSNVTWYRGNTQVATGNSYTITQAGSYSYTASGTGGCGASSCCPIVVEDGVIPTLAITPSNPAICAGTSVSLTASATGVGSSAGTMTWSDGTTVAANTSTIVRTPVSTTAYSVTFTSSEYGTCSASTSTTVTVNPNPVVTLTSATICAGTTATLSASVAAAGTYTYAFSSGLTPTAPGSASATTAALTTAGTFPYSVTATSAEGCSSTATASVTVNPNPVVTLTSATICAGTTATLSASVAAAGTYTYAFSTGLTPTAAGSADATTGVLSATGTTTYSVTAISAEGCSSTAVASVTVDPNPVATITASSLTACQGTNILLTSTGGNTFSWSTGETTASISVTVSGTYSVTVGNATTGCTSTTNVTVTVLPTPVLAVTTSAPSATLCAGVSTTLTVSGCSGNVVWSTGDTGASLLVQPLVTTTYSLTCTLSTGCSATTAVTVNVNEAPAYDDPATVTAATCAGATANNDARIAFATLRNTAKAAYSMGTTYTGPDFNGATAVSSNSITFSGLANPNTRQAYTVRLYSAGGSCFTDVVVYLNPAQCICPTPKCVPVVIRKTR
ncbi:SdrD B-like domain-containing protein [Spirosoma oryzae]|nr:SdrD B-like domain-containing protein [Spirosoma oryzae]